MADLIDRKAAIKAMLELQKEDDDTYGCHIPEAFHGERAAEALKALRSVEPKRTAKRTETHACDLISRQAVTDTVRAIILGFFSDEDSVMTDTEKTLLSVNKAICNGVRELPSAQPERKTGRWIHDGYAFRGGIDWMHCSECGHKDSWSAATRTPFCAWCGARMEDNNEDK